jgi:hypothetical protein
MLLLHCLEPASTRPLPERYALAARYRTDRLLTLDHRHFRVVRSIAGKPFALLP